MTIDLSERPILSEFDLMQEIRNALIADDEHFKENFRLKLESANNHQPTDDFKTVLHQSDIAYQILIDGVRTQEDYNDVYRKVFDVKAVAFVLQFDMKAYINITEKYITQIEKSQHFCPICGEEIKKEYVDGLKKEVAERRTLEWFYGEYCQRRMKDSKRLVDIATKNGFDKFAWQKIYQNPPTNVRQYVSSQDNYDSKFEKIKKNHQKQSEETERRTTNEMASEWIVKKQAAGFKFGGE